MGGREGRGGGEGRPRSVGAAGGDRARSFDRRDARAGRPPRRRRTALASRLAPRRARPHLYTATKNMSATIANTGASLPVPRFRDMGCSDPPPREAGRFSSAGLVFPLSIASSRASHRPARARNRATRAPNLRTEEAARAKTTRRAGRDPARREGGVRARRGERNTRATQTRPTRPSHDERRNCAGSGAPCVTASNFFNRGSDSAPCDCVSTASISDEGKPSATTNRIPPWPRPSGSVRARPGGRGAARRACTASTCKECGARAKACARSAGARPEGRRARGSEASARSAGARASASTGGSEAGARSAGQCKECGGSGICEHGRLEAQKECGGAEHLRAREAAIPVQGVRGRARSRNPSQLSSNPAPLAMAYLTFSLIVARLL